jgi:bifunctional lysine-specific demethylase and histidyl-hydroxylase NO66
MSMVGGLEWFLDPITPSAFFEKYYETAPLHVRRDDADRFVGLPNVEDVDFLLTATVSTRARPGDGERLVRAEADGSLSERRVMILPDSGAVDVQAVYRAYTEGFTLIVNQVHRRSSPVALLCHGLQADLHHPVGANLYVTPARSQGFLPHADTHDVFIVQLHGTKEWHVSAPHLELPLANETAGRQTLPDARTYELAPGDLLYLPRGFRHAALTGSSSSTHLTVGVEAFRWRDVFREAIDLLAGDDVAFRAALPVQYFDEPFASERVADLASRLGVALGDESFLERARERMRSKLVATSVPAGFSRFSSLDALVALDAGSVVLRNPSVACVVRASDDEAIIEFLGNYVAGPRFLAPAFQFIATKDRFTVAELPGDLSLPDRLDLVGRLVSEGLLEVDGNGVRAAG